MSFINSSQTMKKVKSLNDKLFRCKKELNLIESSIFKNDIVSFCKHLKELYINLEKSCIYSRNFATNEIPDEDLLQIIADKKVEKSDFLKQLYDEELENSEIEIVKLDEDIIQITMPIITPFVYYRKLQLYPTNKNNAKKSTVIDAIERRDFLLYALENAVKKFSEENKIDSDLYKKSTLLFVNIFDNEYKKNRIPDTNNYSYKPITDLITSYISGCGDSAFSLDFTHKSVRGNKTRTEIYLIPKQFNSIYEQIISSDCECNPKPQKTHRVNDVEIDTLLSKIEML